MGVERLSVKPPPGLSIAGMVSEALDRVASPSARETIIARALEATGRDEMPDHPDGLTRFVAGPLCDAAAGMLGAEAADAVIEDLEPLLRLAALQAREHYSEPPPAPTPVPLVEEPRVLDATPTPVFAPRVGVRRSALGRQSTLSYGKRPVKTPPGMSPLVLVVDDDGPFLNGLMRMLRQEGYDVVTAPDGAAALRLCRRLRPAIVVTDLMMPEMDGAELARRVAELDDRTHILLLTGAPEVPRELPGVSVVMKKDVRPSDLMAKLAALAGVSSTSPDPG